MGGGRKRDKKMTHIKEVTEEQAKEIIESAMKSGLNVTMHSPEQSETVPDLFTMEFTVGENINYKSFSKKP